MSKYFIFRISQGPAGLVKKLVKIDQHDSYRDAKSQVRVLRTEQSSDDNSLFKIIFADSELDAEQRLQEKRDAPIVKEWEK
jgi:hypothetical protein